MISVQIGKRSPSPRSVQSLNLRLECPNYINERKMLRRPEDPGIYSCTSENLRSNMNVHIDNNIDICDNKKRRCDSSSTIIQVPAKKKSDCGLERDAPYKCILSSNRAPQTVKMIPRPVKFKSNATNNYYQTTTWKETLFPSKAVIS